MVSAEELKRMMVQFGNALTDEEVRDIMKESGSGTALSYSAFCRLLGVGIKQRRAMPAWPNTGALKRALSPLPTVSH